MRGIYCLFVGREKHISHLRGVILLSFRGVVRSVPISSHERHCTCYNRSPGIFVAKKLFFFSNVRYRFHRTCKIRSKASYLFPGQEHLCLLFFIIQNKLTFTITNKKCHLFHTCLTPIRNPQVFCWQDCWHFFILLILPVSSSFVFVFRRMGSLNVWMAMLSILFFRIMTEREELAVISSPVNRRFNLSHGNKARMRLRLHGWSCKAWCAYHQLTETLTPSGFSVDGVLIAALVCPLLALPAAIIFRSTNSSFVLKAVSNISAAPVFVPLIWLLQKLFLFKIDLRSSDRNWWSRLCQVLTLYIQISHHGAHHLHKDRWQ